MRSAVFLVWAGCLSAQTSLHFDRATGALEVRGIEPAVAAKLAYSSTSLGDAVAAYFGSAATPMLGDWSLRGSELRFEPRFPLMGGREYRVRVDTAKLRILAGLAESGGAIELRITTPAAALSEPTRVVRVSPASVVPANVLRMYIHFSAPMTRRGILDHLRLEGPGGTIPQAFLEMEEGLWDPEARRLTVFFHPGRIKRGLELNEKSGLALQPAARYRLLLSKHALDEEGLPLAEDFVHEFAAGAEDRQSPDVSAWKIGAAPAGTLQPLVVTADEALDEALLARLVRVETENGIPVAGDAAVEDSRRWRFTPRDPWQPGTYVLRVNGWLEDLAGNKPGRLFDEQSRERKDLTDQIRRFAIR